MEQFTSTLLLSRPLRARKWIFCHMPSDIIPNSAKQCTARKKPSKTNETRTMKIYNHKALNYCSCVCSVYVFSNERSINNKKEPIQNIIIGYQMLTGARKHERLQTFYFFREESTPLIIKHVASHNKKAKCC